MRGIFAGALALSVGSTAPFQCAHDPDPRMRIEDTAGDALWALGEKFASEGNYPAATETLKYLVDRYPGNRHAPGAKDVLAAGLKGPLSEPDGGS